MGRRESLSRSVPPQKRANKSQVQGGSDWTVFQPIDVSQLTSSEVAEHDRLAKACRELVGRLAQAESPEEGLARYVQDLRTLLGLGPMTDTVEPQWDAGLLSSLADKDRELTEKECDLVKKERQLAEKERELTEKDRELVKLCRELTDMQCELEAKDSELAAKDRELATKDDELAAKDTALATKDDELAAKDTALATKDGELAAKDSEIAAKDQKLDKKSQKLSQVREQLQGVQVREQYQVALLQSQVATLTAELKLVADQWAQLSQLSPLCNTAEGRHQLITGMFIYQQQAAQLTHSWQYVERKVVELNEKEKALLQREQDVRKREEAAQGNPEAHHLRAFVPVNALSADRSASDVLDEAKNEGAYEWRTRRLQPLLDAVQAQTSPSKFQSRNGTRSN